MSAGSVPSTFTVSNGLEFRQVAADELPSAIEEGFYRPGDRGQTIVGNEEYQFEIPIANLESAREDGLSEMLADESQAGLGESALILDGLTQAEEEVEQARLEAEEELAEAEGWRWYAVWMRQWLDARKTFLIDQVRSNGVSAAVHLALLLVLASLALKTETEPPGVLLASAPSTEDAFEETVIETTPLEITEPTEPTESESVEEAEVEMTETVAAPDFLAGVSGDAIKPPAAPAKPAKPAKPMKAEPKKTTFFGKKVEAINYVFVIDNSNSMGGGRFETALHELMIAVNQLTDKQRFYVIFYSDTAYPMLHPNAEMHLAPATAENKEILRRWLFTVPLCFKTNGRQAISAAFSLQPDVIFVLGDGAFTDKADRYFAAMPKTRVVVHTLGMEVKPEVEAGFASIARAHGGTYKNVGVHPAARELAKSNPRPRNNIRGPVWGITLPLTARPKKPMIPN